MGSIGSGRAVSVLAAAAVVALGGCGADDKSATGPVPVPEESSSGEGGGAGQTLRLSADPGGKLAFDKERLTAKAGKVTLSMANPSELPHAVAIEGNGLDEDGNTVGQGGTSKVTATLRAGLTYTFYCPVGMHEAGGMKGKLTVR